MTGPFATFLTIIGIVLLACLVIFMMRNPVE